MIKWLIEREGVEITVCAKSTDAAELVDIALDGMRAKRVHTVHGVKLSVSGTKDDWVLQDHSNDVRRKLINASDLIYHLSGRIVFHIADKVTSKHCLHAAAVSHAENALMIPADSGAGKSSLTTWLVANGFAYITDELILIDDHQRIEGLGRPIQIKVHGLDAIKSLVNAPAEILEGNLANVVPISSVGGETSKFEEHDLGLIIFPQYRKDAQYSFIELSKADAGMRLMGNHVNARNLEGHGFRAMMQTIRQVPCYALEYGGFDTLPSDFADQLTALLAHKD